MTRIKDQIFPSMGGLNTDDDPRFFGNGDTDYRLNAVPFGDGSQGLITNMRGNEQITHAFAHETPTYDGATYKIIGGCYDEKRNAYYYFIHSSLSNHCILRYNIDAGTFSRIVWDSPYIGLDDNHPISDPFVMGDYLFWNPVSSSPRMLHIQWCDNYYIYDGLDDPATYDNGDYFQYNGRVFVCLVDGTVGADAEDDIDNGEYVLTRWTGDYCLTPSYNSFYNTVLQPSSRPKCVYGDDTTINYNNLKGRLFQFSYRIVLGDGRSSLYSSFTNVIGQNYGETYYGDLSSNIKVENKISITIYLDFSVISYDYRRVISHADIVFREMTDSGWGSWKLIDRVMWGSFTGSGISATVDFYNDKNYVVIDQDEVAMQYNPLPITATAQSPILKNRVGYAGITDGISPIVPNISITANFVEQYIDVSGTLDTTYTVNETITPVDFDGDGVTDWNEYSYIIVVPAVTTAGYAVTVTINNDSASLLVTAGMAASLTVYRNAIRDLIIVNFGMVASTVGTGIQILSNKTQKTVTCKVYSSPVSSFTKTRGYKTGAKHKFCLFYYDELMRRTGAIKSESLEVYLPFITEQSITNAGYIYKYYLTYSLNHLPPPTAKYWRFGYAGNTTVSKMWQYTVKSVSNAAAASSGTRVYNNDTGQYPQYSSLTEISIDPLQLHKEGDGVVFEYSFPNSNIDLYDFQPGDRVRFIMNSTGGGAVVPLSTYYDYEIKAYDDSGDEACIFIENVSSPAIGARGLVEIYRPKKEDESVVYYEIGDLRTTYYDSGVLYHNDTGTDQSSGVPATGVIDGGDIYHVSRVFSYHISTGSAVLYPVESFSYSDFYDSEGWGKGKTGYVDNIGQTTSNTLRYSDTWLEGTKTNGLSTFGFSGYVDFTNLYGSVYAMRAVGSVLKIITDSAVISAGMGVQEYADASGSYTVATSDKIIGYQRVSKERYGTIHPESVCVVDGVLYFWDYKNASVVRDAGNGLYPISGAYPTPSGGEDHKMRTRFRQMRDTMLSGTYTNYIVWMAYERNYDMLYIYFKNKVSSASNVILGYHISSGRWFSYYDWKTAGGIGPYFIGGGGRFFTSTYGESMYKHFSSTANRCTFYGSAKTFEVRVYTFEGNNEVKVYDRFAIQCNSKPQVNDVTVTTLEDNSGSMKSVIPAGYIEKIENGWYAPFLRNVLTYSPTATDGTANYALGLVNGDLLRGNTLRLDLDYTTATSEITIYKVVVGSELSNI